MERRRKAAAAAEAARIEDRRLRREQSERRRRKAAAEASGAADVLRMINTVMVARDQRLKDIFKALDASGDGVIEHSELADGLRKLACPNRDRAPTMLERRAEAEARARAAREARLRQRLLAAEQSGAAKLLMSVDAHLAAKKIKLSDAFADFDVTGDGALSRAEMSMALSLLELSPKLTRAEISSVVDFLDADGSGDVDVAELGAALRELRALAREIPGGFGSGVGAFASDAQLQGVIEARPAAAFLV